MKDELQSDWLPLAGGGVGFVQASWRDRFAAAGLKTVADFLKAEGEALSKPGLGTRYRARLRLGSEVVYLKRFAGDKFFDRFRRWREDGVWHSPAEREMRAAEALRSANLPATRALAWGKQTDNGVEHSFVILSAAPGEPADNFLKRQPGPAAQQRLTRPLAELARRFHAAGWRHRDFYLCHIFADEPVAGELALTLIDLQRVFRPRDANGRWRVKDLAQLDYSAAEVNVSPRLRLRFFRDYCVGESCAAKRRLLRAIQDKTAAMAKRANKFG